MWYLVLLLLKMESLINTCEESKADHAKAAQRQQKEATIEHTSDVLFEHIMKRIEQMEHFKAEMMNEWAENKKVKTHVDTLLNQVGVLRSERSDLEK